jgi:predicted chitinase
MLQDSARFVYIYFTNPLPLMAELTPDQKRNAKEIVAALNSKGITNRFYAAAVLGIVYKESGLVPRTEKGYGNTSIDRIRIIFPTKTKPLSDEQLATIKKSDQDFFNLIYAGIAGNSNPSDGYTYRGRGYNQLTGRANYSAMSKHAGIDLVLNPDKVNDPAIAARVIVGYKLDTINPSRLAEYKLKSLNDIPDLPTAVRIAMRQTAGWKKSVTGSIFKEGETRAMEFAAKVLNLPDPIV